MLNFNTKLSHIAKDTDFYLKKIFLNKKKNRLNLTAPMKYGVFSGGKRFRSSIIKCGKYRFKTSRNSNIIFII